MPNLALANPNRNSTGYTGSELLIMNFSSKLKLLLKYCQYSSIAIKDKKLLTVPISF